MNSDLFWFLIVFGSSWSAGIVLGFCAFFIDNYYNKSKLAQRLFDLREVFIIGATLSCIGLGVPFIVFMLGYFAVIRLYTKLGDFICNTLKDL